MGLLAKDLEYHCLVQCSNHKEICPTCEEEVPETHNCFEILKQRIKEAREENTSLRQDLNIVDDDLPEDYEIKVECDEGHQMEPQRGRVA